MEYILGKIANEIKGLNRNEKWSDLWYIFEPQGYDKTLAEMTEEERETRNKYDAISAMEEFAKWYEENEEE